MGCPQLENRAQEHALPRISSNRGRNGGLLFICKVLISLGRKSGQRVKPSPKETESKMYTAMQIILAQCKPSVQRLLDKLYIL